MKNRYDFLKKIYNNYLIFFLSHNKIKLYDKTEREIYKCFRRNNKYHVNYIIVDNMDILKRKEYSDNSYVEILCKIKLAKLIKRYKREALKCV